MKKNALYASVASYAIGFLYISCFLFGFYGDVHKSWYPLLFAAVFTLWGLYTLEKPLVPARLPYLICMLLTALAAALGLCHATSGWSTLALHGFAVCWVLSWETWDESWICLLANGLRGVFLTPFQNFFLREKTLFASLRGKVPGKGNRRLLLSSVVAIALALPLFLLAGNLLGQADSGFQALTDGFLSLFRLDMPQWLGFFLERFLFGLPIGAYLYGMLASAPPALPQVLRKSNHGSFPCRTVQWILGAFIGLYILFFAVQANTLLAVFRNQVPGNLTASAYARSGFFQLCQVMTINFLLVGLSNLLTKDPGRLKLACQILMVQSVFLAVSAAGKLLLYIRRFGFTPLRLLSFWAVLVLTAGSLLTMANLQGKKRCLRLWLWFASLTFTALCFY